MKIGEYRETNRGMLTLTEDGFLLITTNDLDRFGVETTRTYISDKAAEGLLYPEKNLLKYTWFVAAACVGGSLEAIARREVPASWLKDWSFHHLIRVVDSMEEAEVVLNAISSATSIEEAIEIAEAIEFVRHKKTDEEIEAEAIKDMVSRYSDWGEETVLRRIKEDGSWMRDEFLQIVQELKDKDAR